MLQLFLRWELERLGRFADWKGGKQPIRQLKEEKLNLQEREVTYWVSFS